MAIPEPNLPKKEEELEETPESVHLSAISSDTEVIADEIKKFNTNFEKFSGDFNQFLGLLKQLADSMIPKV